MNHTINNAILAGLNKEQQEAVLHKDGPLLILAGAGSGKTRVLTHRIAYLIDEYGVNPWNILAVTFTNKAAKEMRERVDNIVDYGAENIWVSTFHSTCVRILRRYIEALGYDRSFAIYDADDQRTLMKEICKYLSIDTKNIKERAILSAISSAKDKLISPERFAMEAQGDFIRQKYASAYTEYQKRLKANNALDFDDLICKTVELFESHPDILESYQERFLYIMVDEYQDTNTSQFRLIHLLSSKYQNLCVVGDDDQSIYKFRGANIHNILDFEKQFPNAKVIKLEQNYRSTKNILKAANEVIHNNLERKEKALWTDNEEGAPIHYCQLDTAYNEAEFVVNGIQEEIQKQKKAYSDFAILYRTNAQSRILEEKLVQSNIPYKIIGAVNFYARKEIKDLLCYLKTIDNGQDDMAVKRIINVPRRGIGLATIDRISDYAFQNDMSFFKALHYAAQIPGVNRAARKIESFVSLIEILKGKLRDPSYSLEDLMKEILEATDYIEDLKKEGTTEAESRIENIDELLNKIVAFEADAEEPPSLNEFLEEVALVADIDNLEDSNDVVVLMTLHSAKGLEFPYVYMCGMEDGMFPSYMSIVSEDASAIEEERRLCYVGITRARQQLFLSSARVRMVHGESHFNKPSRFIHEIPRYLFTQSAPAPSSRFGKPQASKLAPSGDSGIFKGNPAIQKGVGNLKSSSGMAKARKVTPFPDLPSGAAPSYQVGDSVEHSRFGIGTVAGLNKLPNDYEVIVDFANSGRKKMRASFAKLKQI